MLLFRGRFLVSYFLAGCVAFACTTERTNETKRSDNAAWAIDRPKGRKEDAARQDVLSLWVSSLVTGRSSFRSVFLRFFLDEIER